MIVQVSSATANRKLVWIGWSTSLLVVLAYVSCGPQEDIQPSRPTLNGLEFRIVLGRESCEGGCKAVEFSSILEATSVLWVRERPDLVLRSEEIESVVPISLSSLNSNRPESIVWTGRLNLASEATVKVRNLGSELSAQDRILVSMDGEPLGVIYARLLGQRMGLGEFSSRDKLVETLGRLAEVQEGSRETLEVFSREELAAERELDKLLSDSERARSEIEMVQRLAAEGEITHDELVKRLRALRKEDAGS